MKTDPELAARIAAAWQRQAAKSNVPAVPEPTPTASTLCGIDASGDGTAVSANGFHCRHCPSREFIDVPIHAGASVRRDCAECGRFVAFVRWYGEEREEQPEVPAEHPVATGPTAAVTAWTVAQAAGAIPRERPYGFV